MRPCRRRLTHFMELVGGFHGRPFVESAAENGRGVPVGVLLHGGAGLLDLLRADRAGRPPGRNGTECGHWSVNAVMTPSIRASASAPAASASHGKPARKQPRSLEKRMPGERRVAEAGAEKQRALPRVGHQRLGRQEQITEPHRLRRRGDSPGVLQCVGGGNDMAGRTNPAQPGRGRQRASSGGGQRESS